MHFERFIICTLPVAIHGLGAPHPEEAEEPEEVPEVEEAAEEAFPA